MSLKEIIEFVKDKHKDQVDLAGEPYFNHLSRVANKVPSSHKSIAYLHDILEDTDTTIEELINLGISKDVVYNIITLTRIKRESYENYIERISLNHIASRIKIADLEDNMNPCRLKELTDKEVDRLKKYHKAYIYLKYKK